MRVRSLRQPQTRYWPPNPPSLRSLLHKTAQLVRAIAAGVGVDGENLRFKVQGSRFKVLRFKGLRFKVRNPPVRRPRSLSSKILEIQRTRTTNREGRWGRVSV
jgi:hypothetical protein